MNDTNEKDAIQVSFERFSSASFSEVNPDACLAIL